VTWPARAREPARRGTPDQQRGERLGDETSGDAGPPEADLALLRSSVDLAGLPALSRAVTEQVICDTADLSYATDLICYEPALAAAVAALTAGAPLIADVPMVAAGITGPAVICKADDPLTVRLARTAGIARPAAAVRLALGTAGAGAIWVIGGEPASLYEILAREAEPTLVIGFPAGLATAADAKAALRASGVPSLTNMSAKGGPGPAVAACAALIRQALGPLAFARSTPAPAGALARAAAPRRPA
jgi:precorrin-8X/cobalt-precorrin-8 methylmutase